MSFWDGRRWVQEPRVGSGPRPAKPRRLRDFAATAVMIIGLVAILAPLTTSNAAAAALVIAPSSAPVGAMVQVLGSNLPSRARIQLALDGSADGLPTLRVARDGTIKARLVVPATEVGPHTLTAVSMNRAAGSGQAGYVQGAVLAAGSLTVTAPVVAVEPTPSLVPTPTPMATASGEPSPPPQPSEPVPAPSATQLPPSPTLAPTPVAPPPPVVSAGFVGRNGSQLILDGAPFRFTGLNIYNANGVNNCSFTMGAGSALDEALTEVGPGQEAIRAWFYQPLAVTNGQRDWSAFDHTLASAAAHGVRVIFTLADQWGSCDSHPYPAAYKTDSWYMDGYRSEVLPGHLVPYREWVAEAVVRYRDNPTILAWQLMNEAEIKPSVNASVCTAGAAEILKAWADDVSGLIRSLDSNHLISLGTIGGGQCGSSGPEYPYVHSGPNIDLCEYHDYGSSAPMPGDEWNGLAVRLQQCSALGKPVFVGETGVTITEAGTLEARAGLFDQKFQAQFAAGVVGQLVWAWGTWLETYNVIPGDPTLEVVRRY